MGAVAGGGGGDDEGGGWRWTRNRPQSITS